MRAAPLAAAPAFLLGCLAVTPAFAESQYIVEQLVVSVSATADGSGDRVGSVHSGERVEVLERDEEHARIRFGSGQEGWIKASYLSSDPPLKEQLEERAQQLTRLNKENATLQAQVAELQRAAAASAAAARTAPQAVAAPAAAPAADPPVPDQSAPASSSRPEWWWLIATAGVAVACGFILGWRLLDRRIRKRYGGLRIY